MHREEKFNECNQCEYESYRAGDLKTHSEEKSNKCNQCRYTSSQLCNLRRHLKTHIGKSQTNVTNVALHPQLEDAFKDTQWTKIKEM